MAAMPLLHGLAAAALGAGLGVQVFFSFMVAPAAFQLVERELAVRLMDGLFPGYYGFGLATTAGACVLMLVLAVRTPAAPLRWGALALVTTALVGTVYAGHVLLPQARAARLRAQSAGPGDLAPLEFSRLHRRAIVVNIALTGAGALALVLHAAAPVGRGRP